MTVDQLIDLIDADTPLKTHFIETIYYGIYGSPIRHISA